ncbi:hypothetical protein [Luteolibacter sp. LG18]|uniref:hypothetical protein n=1 Tax=Luteolibacter sp. LG18 TaxID=2819286 RepID=UPI002B308D7F|nr:hypothetical protein llg_24200 [Luteolibacter sp. LG18]
MKFYIRQSDSGDLRGPLSREEIAAQLPREIDRRPWMALADRGTRPENLPQSQGWVPLATLFPKIEIPSKAPSRYASERMWIDRLSRYVIAFAIGNALFQLYLAMTPGVPFATVAWSALGSVSLWCLGALGVRYIVRILADIAETLQDKPQDG